MTNSPLKFTSWFDVLAFLFGTKQGQRLIRFTIIVIGVCISLAIYWMRPDKIDVTTEVGVLTIKTGSTQNAVFLLNATGGNKNTAWASTGIKIKTGDKVRISASGQVHTSVKWLTAKALSPQFNETTWAGPEGLERRDDYPLRASRNKYKVLPDKGQTHYGYGMLLAAVKDSQGIDYIEPFDSDKEIMEFTAKKDGELVLTVNEIWLNSEMKAIYVPSIDNFAYYLNAAHLFAFMRGENFEDWSEAT